MISRALIPLALGLLLSACVGGGKPPAKPQGRTPAKPTARVPVQPRPAVVRPAPVVTPPPPARVLSAPGLEGVIGAGSAELVRQFGPARLDVWEGDARKLQFAGTACVLDVFLYPLAAGREPQATYVDARRASDGQDVDRAACINALRRPGPAAN